MSVPVCGSRAFRTACAALVQAVLGGRGGRAEGLFEEGHADALRPADGAQGGRGPGLPLDHLGEQGEPDGDHLAVLGKPGDGLVEEGVLLGGQRASVFGQNTVGPAECREDLAGVQRVEEVGQGAVLSLEEPDFQVAHEPARGEPEVVADHHDGLEMLAVALPQRGDQLGVGLVPPGEQPLLELVEHEQHLLAGPEATPPAQGGQGVDQPEFRSQVGARPTQGFQQPGLGLVGRRLDVNREDMLLQPGQQPRLDQRRLAAARGAVDQADLEGGVGVGRLDAGLPEPERIGKAVAVAGAGEQLEEEVGVVLVERPQPLGHDLDGGAAGRVGVGPRRG